MQHVLQGDNLHEMSKPFFFFFFFVGDIRQTFENIVC